MPNRFLKTFSTTQWSRLISWKNCAASGLFATAWKGGSPTSSREEGIRLWCSQNTGQPLQRPAISWSNSKRRRWSKVTEGISSSRSLETFSSKWLGSTCKRGTAYISHKRRPSWYGYSSYQMWDSGWPVRCSCSYRNLLLWKNRHLVLSLSSSNRSTSTTSMSCQKEARTRQRRTLLLQAISNGR